jgi:hypothetical protein
MAFDNDKSSLVPEPPPPRPARRDAAIEAALRRFDGIEDHHPATPSTSWARKHRPQFGVLVTAGLIAAIGLPLALMAIRDRPVTTTGEVASPATAESQSPSAPCVGKDCLPDGAPAAVEKQGAPPSAARVAEIPSLPPPPAPPPPRADQGKALAFGENRPLAKSVAASPPAIAAPAPQAPPPAVAEKVAQDAMEGQVVVTGSLIAAPQKSSVGREKRERSASVAAGRVAARDAGGAPEGVLQDRAYEIFLARLQAAVRANDRSALIQLIAFPLRVNFKGGSQLYRDARSVGRDYDRIFTPQVRRAILDQRVNQLFGRDQGVMVGNGEIWFEHSPAGPVRIKAVNP